MRRAFTSFWVFWILLGLLILGGSPPRVWCSGPEGHAAVESLASTCCSGRADSCLRPSAPVLGPSHPETKGPPSGASPMIGADEEACSDSLLAIQPAPTVTPRFALLLPLHPAGAAMPPASHAGACRTPCPKSPAYGLPVPLDSRTALLI